MAYCTETVMHNLVEGIVLVTVIVFLWLTGEQPLLLLLLFLWHCYLHLMLKLKGMSANLISLGAIDFGIIIDGAVVMVEGIFVASTIRQKK
ncbi:MAG: efflux RND transporter permease subunit [Crocinitomicaceae bacterium]